MGKNKVLIVEDEIIVAKDIQHSLERLGYEIIGIASDQDQVIKLIDKASPNIVLMDIMLRNEQNGVEIAEFIRTNYHIPVIFLTAYADSVTIDRAKLAESYGYILKPFKVIDLQTNIELAIYKHSKEMQVEKERNFLQNFVENTDSTMMNDIYVRSSNKLIRLKKDKILFVEALKDYVMVHLQDKKYTIHTSMKEIESKLGNKLFIRIHRSFIVRLDVIESIELSNLSIENTSHILPIGGSYKEELFSKINTI
jgi:DNA-binding LytR/AlgR family response regulator